MIIPHEFRGAIEAKLRSLFVEDTRSAEAKIQAALLVFDVAYKDAFEKGQQHSPD